MKMVGYEFKSCRSLYAYIRNLTLQGFVFLFDISLCKSVMCLLNTAPRLLHLYADSGVYTDRYTLKGRKSHPITFLSLSIAVCIRQKLTLQLNCILQSAHPFTLFMFIGAKDKQRFPRVMN